MLFNRIEIKLAHTTPDYQQIESLADTIWREHYIPITGIGQVEHILIPDHIILNGGHLDLEALGIAGISGLNTYYSFTKIAHLPYVRDEFNLTDLK